MTAELVETAARRAATTSKPPTTGSAAPSPWLKRGAWAVLDQALFASSNFTLGVLLARWLTPVEFGAFSVAYSVFMLLGMFHSSLLIDPMLVFGGDRFRERQPSYLRALLWGHWRFAFLISGMLLLAALAVRAVLDSQLPAALFSLVIAGPFILLLALARKACYVYLGPRTAAIAGAMYMALSLGGIYAVFHFGTLSPVSVLLLMGGASLLAAAYLTRRLGTPWASRREGHDLRAEVTREHWQFGRWAAGAGIVGWIPGNIYYVMLPIWGGLEATAALRAAMNLIQPVLHTFLAVSAVMVTAMVRVRHTPAWRPMVRNNLALFIGGAALYWLFLATFGAELISWLYAGQYDEYGYLLWIVALVPLSGAGVAVLGSALRALERPRHVFIAYVASTCTAATVGVGLLVAFGISGAAVGLAISSLVTAGTMAVLLARSRDG